LSHSASPAFIILNKQHIIKFKRYKDKDYECSLVVKHLPSIHEAQCSVPSNAQKTKQWKVIFPSLCVPLPRFPLLRQYC
jgi:hypothetical protein